MGMSEAEETGMLGKIQRATTKVLGELDRICRELGIRYAVYGGTAIGAVRHRGFIPWDDDVDVCIPRDDYDRLIVEGPALLGPDYVLLSQETDPDYPKTFGILGLAGTDFVPGVAAQRDYRVPIGVDLFPLDRIPRDRRAYVRQNRRTWVWGRMMFLHGSATPDSGLDGIVGAAADVVFRGVHTSLHKLRVTPRSIYRKWEAAARLYNDSGSPVLGDYSTQDPLRWSAREDEIFPTVRVPFESIHVELPRAYDAILTRGYGNYMSLPPKEERVNHAPVRIDFAGHEF
ncbi:LicD family protein [Schaalia vaccimaxillae]|uniref:LicD family protein n=1 Tax=Schaalia vaccimaxillae TaxID=183916 RepID=UPI0003B3F360|nr:LicD family protein [Schaalia vaccimaxillae]